MKRLSKDFEKTFGDYLGDISLISLYSSSGFLSILFLLLSLLLYPLFRKIFKQYTLSTTCYFSFFFFFTMIFIWLLDYLISWQLDNLITTCFFFLKLLVPWFSFFSFSFSLTMVWILLYYDGTILIFIRKMVAGMYWQLSFM